MLTALSIPTHSAWAQAPPPQPDNEVAQAQRRQEERERLLREQQERTPDVRLPRPEIPPGLERLPSDEPVCVPLKNITLVGDAADQFQWALAAAYKLADGTPDTPIGRCLGTQGINLLMRRIQSAIIQRGFVAARVLFNTASRITGGALELTLFPGRIRRIQFAPDTDRRATKWNAVPVKSGDLLNLRDIEQALENFKRIPTAEADIQVVPAEGPDAQPGQSDLVIQWKQRFPFRISLSADDSGARATGKYQGSVTVSYDHWWTLNDIFYVSLNHDLGGGDAGNKGTRGSTAHYSVPLGYWLLSLTTSRNRYHQSVAGGNQLYLHYSGESQNSEAKLSRVMYRDAWRKTTASLRGWTRSAKNLTNDTEVKVHRRRMAGWDLGLSHREFIGGATVEGNLNYRRGTGAWNALPAPEQAFGEGTSRPKIVTADLQLSAPFKLRGESFRYSGTWRGQWNRTPLVPQDRFAIGGRYTVRGFDGENQLLAERGGLVRNDVSWILGPGGQELYLGIDYGQVSGRRSGLLIGKHLSGLALGWRGAYQKLSFDFFIGKPLSKPTGFRTPSSTGGFLANLTF